MPVPSATIVQPQQQSVSVSLEPVHNALYSLTLLVRVGQISGLGEWVKNTYEALAPEERSTHRLVIEGFHFALFPRNNWPSFEAYLDRLESVDPNVLYDRMLDAFVEMPYLGDGIDQFQSAGQALRSADDYVDFLIGRFGEEFIDAELERQAYTYVIDPAAMQTLIVSHLRMMWERFLAVEWRQVQPLLTEAVAAFTVNELDEMAFTEAFHFVTGQQLTDMKWSIREEDFSRMVFVPSAHSGPYLGKFHRGREFFVFFGARLPEGSTFHAPNLSRNELVVRLNALADDTRLRILRYVADNGEQRSQTIMSALDLTQSTASRQLTHLCATGYLSSRLCDGAKCYVLSEESLRDTMRAVLAYLTIST
jgi:hypothetical protein